MSDKTFTYAGFTDGKLRFTTNMVNRVKRLKNGPPEFVQLPKAMTKAEAATHLKTLPQFEDAAAQAACERIFGRSNKTTGNATENTGTTTKGKTAVTKNAAAKTASKTAAKAGARKSATKTVDTAPVATSNAPSKKASIGKKKAAEPVEATAEA